MCKKKKKNNEERVEMANSIMMSIYDDLVSNNSIKQQQQQQKIIQVQIFCIDRREAIATAKKRCFIVMINKSTFSDNYINCISPLVKHQSQTSKQIDRGWLIWPMVWLTNNKKKV